MDRCLFFVLVFSISLILMYCVRDAPAWILRIFPKHRVGYFHAPSNKFRSCGAYSTQLPWWAGAGGATRAAPKGWDDQRKTKAVLGLRIITTRNRACVEAKIY